LSSLNNGGNIQNKKILEFVTKELNFKTSNRKRQNKKQEANLSDSFVTSSESILSLIKSIDINFDDRQVILYNRCNFNGIEFVSKKIISKRCDSCFTISSNNSGLIEGFYRFNNKVYVIGQQLNAGYELFYECDYTQTRSKIFLARKMINYFITYINKIRKCVFINISENNCYISKFSTSHLFN
jgi:hypothetical protein